ncbi:putative lipoprotein [Burkholderia aenigmatica]|uniref:Putative lipoprotein n=1 Tax=Burkholderia aenigmatica TaxID=2015348 RepID=A0A6P2QK71_9BURK|nr:MULTISPECIES: HNH endonuclease [Burkholderia]VWC20530.1 putative lipoprotein [Burkholderia aenigmatica]
MASEDRFKQLIITTLAKRSAYRCANPDCGTITSGPTEDPNNAINVGEAAHIYGANPGSARYEPAMTSAERSAITNAIWLCSNCHKKVDDDPLRYPAGLMFEWQRAHESHIAEQIGKSAADIRRRYEQRHLEELGRLSYLSERIILEKGEFWKFRLTAEILRYEMLPILQRWSALERGLYIKPATRIATPDIAAWFLDRMHEIRQLADAFSALMNTELARAWGEPGVAGSDVEIIGTCRLIAEMCSSALAWEESVRFSRVDEPFSEVHGLLSGAAADFFEQARKVPEFLSSVIEQNPIGGHYELNLVLGLPDDFAENIHAATERAMAMMQRHH